MLVVVNQQDNIIGSATYEEIHSQGILHRLVLVYVFDRSGRFFLQKRASIKVHGGLYGESVCSHVRKGEDYFETASRALREELGLQDVPINEIVKSLVYTEDKEWKNNTFVKIYECITEKTPKVNKSEIQEGNFYDLSKVIYSYWKEPERFVPGFRQTFMLYLDAKFKNILSD